MRLFLMLVVLLMVQYKTFGQQILIKEDFSFEYLTNQILSQNLVSGTYTYTSGSSNSGNRSKRLKTHRLVWDNYPNEYHYEDFVWYLGNYEQFDSLTIDADHLGGGLRFQISSDSLEWVDVTGVPYNVNSELHPYLRLFDDYGNRELDNLLVVGYSDVPITNCQYDSNQDGAINAPDLIDFLSWYGTTAVCN